MVAAALVASPALAQETKMETPKPITLDQALEIAFKESPEIKAALSEIEKAKGGQSEAAANFMPRFDAEMVHTRQGPVVSFTLPGSPKALTVVQPQNTTANVGFMLPVDVSRKLHYVTDIANYQFQLNYLAMLSVSQKLIFDVKTSYYDYLRAQGQEEVAQAAVDVASARLKDANARYAVGSAPKFDVTRAQVDVGNFNQRLIQARSRVGVTRAALNRVMGIDVNTPTEVVLGQINVENIKVDAIKSVQEAYAKRPEVHSAETAIALGKKNVRLQRTAILPSLSAHAEYDYSFRAAGLSGSNLSWIALMDLKLPVWDGGVTKAKVDQANADVQTSTQNLDKVKLGVGLEVKSAALVLQEGIERVATTAENVAMAEEALRLATVRYNGGISTMVEVTDSESALTQAKVDFVNARYDYVLGIAGLQRATGAQPELAKLQLLGTEYRLSK